MSKAYHLAAVGGTFDHFHLGHAHLLHTAFSVSEKVVIGLTQTPMLAHKLLSGQIEPYSQRKNKLLKFLTANHYHLHSKIVPLPDAFGPALTDPNIEAVIVSQQTYPGAVALNRKRETKNLPPLPIITCRMVLDDLGEHISSTAIRQGIISDQGETYSRCLQRGLTLKPNQKTFFQKPHGRITTSLPETEIKTTLSRHLPVIAVGDRVIETFAPHPSLHPTHLIYDSHIERKPVKPTYISAYSYPMLSVVNPPGTITFQAINAVKQALRLERCLLAVAGEEDLLAVPALLLAPLGSLIIYGQPGKGLVVMPVTAHKKQLVNRFLKKSRLDN